MFLGLAIRTDYKEDDGGRNGLDAAHRRKEILSILSAKGHITAKELAWEWRYFYCRRLQALCQHTHSGGTGNSV